MSNTTIITKDDERKALAKIKTIVEGLGKDSYVATAFEGVFQVAEDNINNDWACSLLQTALAAEKQVEQLSAQITNLQESLKAAEKQHNAEVGALSRKLDKAEHELEVIKANREALKEENASLTADRNELRGKLNTVSFELEQLKQIEANQPIRNIMRLMALGAMMCDAEYDREAKKEYLKQEVKDGYITTDEAIDLVVEFM